MDKLFSFDGRIGRQTFWLVGVLGLGILGMINNFLFGPTYEFNIDTGAIDSYGGSPIYWIFGLILFVPSLSIVVRRWHDHNKSGWWYFIVLIPIVGAIYALVKLGFMSGDDGPNNYGPPHTPGKIL